jgi:hypothetical protein
MKPTTEITLTIRRTVLLTVIAASLYMSCCRDSALIWSAESRSPDGRLLASAQTDQFSGPGTAHVGTTVFLKQIGGSRPPVEILEFSNDSAYPPGVTSVRMNWTTASHLEVMYQSGATLDFQAVKCFGIDISVRDLPR